MAARILTALAAALLLVNANASWAQSADPPGRVGRLSAIDGNVQQRTADDNDWTQANLNYPVTSGFAIAPQEGGRAEIQVGSMALRVGAASELDINSLGDHDATLTLAQGELNVRLGRLPNGDRIEIVTPRGIIDILAAGQYHIDAGTTGSPTRFEVFNGRAQLQRDAGGTALTSGQAALINADDAQSLSMAAAAPDPLDEWAASRDRGPTNRRVAAQPNHGSPQPNYAAPQPDYVSPEMTGAADLEGYGNWNTDPQYGAIWYPSAVPSSWAPYTEGHWAWIAPWGWTWVDDEPWGFAPFHYGRWAYTGIGWGWVPGEVVEAPVYAPALVVFFGGPEHRFFFDRDREGIGWCALGPREAFMPSYGASIAYVRNVNRTNITNINEINITRVNNRIVVNSGRGEVASNFANHRFATVVPANDFGGARRVRDVAVHSTVVSTVAASLPVARDPAVAPLRNTAATGGSANGGAAFNRDRRAGGNPPVPPPRIGSTAAQQNRLGGAGAGAATPSANRFVAGHALPALPSAPGGASKTIGNSSMQGNTAVGAARPAPGPLGLGARNAATNPTAAGLPPVPQAHGGSIITQPNRLGAAGGGNATSSVAGHTLPALPPARGGATVNNHAGAGPTGAAGTQGNAVAPPQHAGRPAGPFGAGAGARNSANAGSQALPPLAPNRGGAAVTNHSGAFPPQGNANPPAAHAYRGAPGPIGAPAGNVSTSSVGHALQLPTRRDQAIKPPSPPIHIAQPPTFPTAAQRHVGNPGPQPAPQVQQFQRTVAAPTHVAPPPAPPARTFQRNVATPTHVAPPAAPARPANNAAVSHAPAPAHAPAAQQPAKNQKRVNNNN